MTHLQAGDQAPAFSSVDQNGDTISLDLFKGQKVVLYFYPKDNTPSCTKQACNIRDNYADLQANGYTVLGISPDSAKSHTNFINKFELPFSLVVDKDREIAEAYGVYGKKKFMGKEVMGIFRTTFLINESGVIERIIKKVVTKDHTAQILEETVV